MTSRPNFRAVLADFNDSDDLEHLARIEEAREVDAIGAAHMHHASQAAIDAHHAILRIAQFFEPEAVVVLHALIVGLRRHNMHTEERQALVHELSVSIKALDEESLVGVLEESVERAAAHRACTGEAEFAS